MRSGRRVFPAEGTASAKALRQNDCGLFEKQKEDQGRWEQVGPGSCRT